MVITIQNALKLWAWQLVPSLLPFMILTSAVSPYLYRFISIFPSKADTWTQRILGLSLFGTYLLLVGQLCGYPIGAKMVKEAYVNRSITDSEAQYLLTICNQSSPAFLEFYVGAFALENTISVIHLFIIFYGATFMTSLITRYIYPAEKEQYQIAFHRKRTASFFSLLDKSISDSCMTILRVGGYIIFFSLVNFSLLTLFSSFGKKVYCLTALLELTNGLSLLKTHFYEKAFYTPFVLALTAFGGFCTMAQIKGMLLGTFLSLKPYIIGKLIYTINVLMLFFLFSKIQIIFFV